MIRALLDQGLPRSAVGLLRDGGWDVAHVGDLGLSTATDEVILARAEAEDRVVVTLDADFHRILAVSGATKPSAVRVREEGLTAEPLAALLLQAVARVKDALEAGAVVTVTARSVRVRRLPILPPRRGLT